MKSLSHCLFCLSLAGFAGAAEPAPPAALAIEALVAEITARHPERQFYAAEIDAARAGRRAAGLRADPELSLEVGRKRVRDPLGNFAGEGTAWSVSLAQTFDWPGRAALRQAIANHQVDLAGLGLARFEHALAARARTLAYGLHAAQVKAAAVREVADRFSDLRETFLAREPAGLAPQLETRIIESAELVLQRRADDAALALQGALLELNQLRGVPTDTPLRVAAAVVNFTPAPPAADLLAGARERNFDYRMKRVEFEQQGVAIDLARHERQPGITVGPYFSQESAGERERTLGLGLSVPLPAGTRSRAGVEVAEARRRQAEAALHATWRDLERDVLLTRHTFATRAASLGLRFSETREKFREAAALADRHYRLGAVPITTYVELQQSYLEAVEALLDTEREALAAGLRLQQLTGLDLQLVTLAP